MQRNLVSALCLTAGLALFAGASRAQNIDPDRVPSTVDAQQREACTPDVMRLCNNYVPDIPQIVACLKRERQNLSPACALVFALETYCPAKDGYSAARIEEEVVVTDKGCRVITLFPAEELPIANRY